MDCIINIVRDFFCDLRTRSDIPYRLISFLDMRRHIFRQHSALIKREGTVFAKTMPPQNEKEESSPTFCLIRTRRNSFRQNYASAKREGRIFANILPYQNEKEQFSPKLCLRKTRKQFLYQRNSFRQ